MMATPKSTTNAAPVLIGGPRLIATTAGVLFLFLAVAYTMTLDYVAMLPYVMRPTAWLAFILFIMAFTASSIQRLRPGGYGKWAMRNRRYIGLSFALVHFIHAGLVLSNLLMTEATRTASVLSGGGLAYVFLGLMAITSTNASVRKLGAKNWKRLHKVGSYYIWLIFMATTAPELLSGELSSIIIPLAGFAALGLRISAHQKSK